MATWQLKIILSCLFLGHLTAIQSNHSQHKEREVSREVLVVLLYPFSSCDQLITADLQFASAFLVAAETINNSSSLNFNMSVAWNDTRCSELVGIEAMTQQWRGVHRVHAFIGPGNESFCATSARLAAAWNLPMISYVSICYLKGPKGRISFVGRGEWRTFNGSFADYLCLPEP